METILDSSWRHVSEKHIWVMILQSNLGEQCMANIPTMVQGFEYKDCTTKHKRPEEALSAPRSSWQAGGEHDTPTWKLSGTQGTASFWERTEAPFPLPRPRCNFIHPKQLSPFPERLKLPFSSEDILSGYEDVVSSGTDQFTTWVKADPDVTLVRHMVDVQKAVAEFREASERRHDTSSQLYRYDNKVPNRSLVQKRLSIYNWNPRPDVERKMLLRNKSQASGTSSQCRKHLSTSTMIF